MANYTPVTGLTIPSSKISQQRLMPQTTNRKHRGLIIRPRDDRWQVDFGTHQGQRKQFSYDTIQEAKTAVDLHLDDRRLETIDRRNRRVAVHDLSDRQRPDIVGAMDLLPGNATLTDAVRFYADHVEPEGKRFYRFAH